MMKGHYGSPMFFFILSLFLSFLNCMMYGDFFKTTDENIFISFQEDQALLKAYIAEWRKFFTQCNYLPMPFGQLETALHVSIFDNGASIQLPPLCN